MAGSSLVYLGVVTYKFSQTRLYLIGDATIKSKIPLFIHEGL